MQGGPVPGANGTNGIPAGAPSGPSLKQAGNEFNAGIQSIGNAGATVVKTGAEKVANVIRPVVQPIVAVGSAVGQAGKGIAQAGAQGVQQIGQALHGH